MHSDSPWKSLKAKGGYTIIEITMVILLIGMIMSLVLPKIEDAALSDTLKNATMVLTSTVKDIRYQAVKDNHEYDLQFKFDSKTFSADFSESAEGEQEAARDVSFALPSDVQVMDICFRDGSINTSGVVTIPFTKEGYITPAIIHLASEDGRKFSVILRPFLGDASVIEEYIEIDKARM